LPKGSHSYDGAHGWNTEWPRIRDIGEKEFLMTMHGTFWKFPKDFTPQKSAGIIPRSNYLKVNGDFCEWQGKVVLGCDDTAKSEFLNKRKAKGEIAPPRSQSNLWFVEHAQLDQLGAPIGRGAVWLNDAVKAQQASDAFLFHGYDQRALHLAHGEKTDVEFLIEVDLLGDGVWVPLQKITAAPGRLNTRIFKTQDSGAWVRLTPLSDCAKVTATFTYGSAPRHLQADGAQFAGISSETSLSATGGLIRALNDDALSLSMVATDAKGEPKGYYTMTADMKLVPHADAAAYQYAKDHTKLGDKPYRIDAASALIIDDKGRRWRFPKGPESYANGGLFGNARVAREVATERDLLNLAGTFYELPAENAGGFAMARPVTTHNRMIHDFCSWHGLLLLSGIDAQTSDNRHIIRSSDGKAALWAGVIDDVWKLGKPRGEGGPWNNTSVKAGQPSDPYLMTGYDRKTMTLHSDVDTMIIVEVDISGFGDWVTYQKLPLKAGVPLDHSFAEGFSAYWIRFSSDRDAVTSAQLRYE